MLTTLFADYLSISLTTSLLLVSLLLLTPLLRKRYSAKWTYWIWMVLAIRLLLPFHFSFGNSLIDIQLPESPIIHTAVQDMSKANTPFEPPSAAQPIQTAVTIVQNEDAKGDELFIGFMSKKEGWIGHACGVVCAENFVFQTSDGGKTWVETGNPNEMYSEHLTGVGFANPNIGFLSFHSTICVLEGLLEYEKAKGATAAVTEACARGQEYLLKRRLVLR